MWPLVQFATLVPIMPPTSYGPLTPDEMLHIAEKFQDFAAMLATQSKRLKAQQVSVLYVHQVASLNRAYRDAQRFQVKLEDSMRQLAKGEPYGPKDSSSERPKESS